MNRRKFFAFALGATAASSLPLFSSPAPLWQRDNGHDDRRGNPQGNQQHGQNRGAPNYRFRSNDSVTLRKHYKGPRKFKGARPRFERGQYLSNDWHSRMRPLPVTVIRQLPPPPPGYQFGYIDGYAVCYDPTTRIIADVLDIVNTATR